MSEDYPTIVVETVEPALGVTASEYNKATGRDGDRTITIIIPAEIPIKGGDVLSYRSLHRRMLGNGGERWVSLFIINGVEHIYVADMSR